MEAHYQKLVTCCHIIHRNNWLTEGAIVISDKLMGSIIC